MNHHHTNDDDDHHPDDPDDDVDLCDLFTIQDYQLITVEIPRPYDDHHPNNNDDDAVVVRCESITTTTTSHPPIHCDDTTIASKTTSATTTTTTTTAALLSLEIFQSPAACTDPDLTGQVLWPVSRLLSHYLAAAVAAVQDSPPSPPNSLPLLCHNKTVLELGAGGTGLPSLVASLCGAALVVATDGNDGVVLDLLRRNIEHYHQQHPHPQHHSLTVQSERHAVPGLPSGTLPKLSCRQLLWGHRDHVNKLRREVLEYYHQTNINYGHRHHPRRRPQSGPTFDYIIAADVVQWPAVLEPLLHTVQAFMWHGHHHDSSADDDDDDDDDYEATESRFILGIVERSSTIYEQFFSLATTMGFRYRHIDSHEYLHNGIVPVTCQEYGGRVTKLFELTLLPSAYSETPLLLRSIAELQQNENDDDNVTDMNYTVGKLYQHTTFLPC